MSALPRWETAPENPGEAISQVKAAIRARIAATGSTVEQVFAQIEGQIASRVAEIQADRAAGRSSWTVVEYSDIAGGTVSTKQIEHLQASGCFVVRGTLEA